MFIDLQKSNRTFIKKFVISKGFVILYGLVINRKYKCPGGHLISTPDFGLKGPE